MTLPYLFIYNYNFSQLIKYFLSCCDLYLFIINYDLLLIIYYSSKKDHFIFGVRSDKNAGGPFKGWLAR